MGRMIEGMLVPVFDAAFAVAVVMSVVKELRFEVEGVWALEQQLV